MCASRLVQLLQQPSRVTFGLRMARQIFPPFEFFLDVVEPFGGCQGLRFPMFGTRLLPNANPRVTHQESSLEPHIPLGKR